MLSRQDVSLLDGHIQDGNLGLICFIRYSQGHSNAMGQPFLSPKKKKKINVQNDFEADVMKLIKSVTSNCLKTDYTL